MIAFFFTIFNAYNNSLTIKDFSTPEKLSEYTTITGYLYNGGMTISALSFILFLFCSAISLKDYFNYKKNNQIN